MGKLRRGSKNGATLVELIVVIVGLGLLIFTLILIINPSKQFSKVYDSQRMYDLNTVATTLDTYYANHNTYPQAVTFGEKFSEGNEVFMQKVPNDPVKEKKYCYMTDGSSFSQWNILFAELDNTQSTPACNLAKTCLPMGYTNQWICKTSGNVDCQQLAKMPFNCVSPEKKPTTSTIVTGMIGACEVRTRFGNWSTALHLSDPDITSEYARIIKQGRYDLVGIRNACKPEDYVNLMAEFCKRDSNPGQISRQIMLYDSNGNLKHYGDNSVYPWRLLPRGILFFTCQNPNNGFDLLNNPWPPK
jgi:Tfp pilus assembly protein PilE